MLSKNVSESIQHLARLQIKTVINKRAPFAYNHNSVV